MKFGCQAKGRKFGCQARGRTVVGVSRRSSAGRRVRAGTSGVSPQRRPGRRVPPGRPSRRHRRVGLTHLCHFRCKRGILLLGMSQNQERFGLSSLVSSQGERMPSAHRRRCRPFSRQPPLSRVSLGCHRQLRSHIDAHAHVLLIKV